MDRVSSDCRSSDGEQPSDLRGGGFCLETQSCKRAEASSAAPSSGPTTQSSKQPRISSSSSSSTIPVSSNPNAHAAVKN